MSCVLTADRTIRSFVVILLSNTVFFPCPPQSSCRCLLPFTLCCAPQMPCFLKWVCVYSTSRTKILVAEALKQKGNREYNGARDHEG